MLTKLRPAAETPGVLRVLLVDRTTNDTMDVRDLLQREGNFRVHAARDVEDARGMLKGGIFDAAVVDFTVWSEGESALLRAVRENHPDLAIVLLTNDDDEHEAREALKLGANDFVGRRSMGEGNQLVTRVMGAVHESRTLRRRDTMVRWLEREALTDHLSGLHNRRAFDDHLREVCDAARPAHKSVAIIVADIAGTSMVNEVHGHDAGDSMNRRAAGAVARSIRGSDLAARIGGDDFGVIIPDGDLDLARLVARRIAQTIERLNTSEWDGDIPVTVTFGVASGIGCTASELFAAADQQLSEHKSVYPAAPLLWLRSNEDGPSVA